MILIEMESTALLSLQGALNRQGGHLSERMSDASFALSISTSTRGDRRRLASELPSGVLAGTDVTLLPGRGVNPRASVDDANLWVGN